MSLPGCLLDTPWQSNGHAVSAFQSSHKLGGKPHDDAALSRAGGTAGWLHAAVGVNHSTPTTLDAWPRDTGQSPVTVNSRSYARLLNELQRLKTPGRPPWLLMRPMQPTVNTMHHIMSCTRFARYRCDANHTETRQAPRCLPARVVTNENFRTSEISRASTLHVRHRLQSTAVYPRSLFCSLGPLSS